MLDTEQYLYFRWDGLREFPEVGMHLYAFKVTEGREVNLWCKNNEASLDFTFVSVEFDQKED